MWSSLDSFCLGFCALPVLVSLISFTGWRKFFDIISSDRFSVSCSLSSFGTPIILMLVCLKLSQRLLTLSSTFWILFSSCFSRGVSFSSLYSKSLIWFLCSSSLLLGLCIIFFISVSLCLISSWVSLNLSVFRNQFDSVDRALAWGLKGPRFDSGQGHVLWLWAHPQ